MTIAKTQKYLKRYAELVIGLKSRNFYLWTRLKISSIFALVLSGFYFTAYLSFVNQNAWMEIVFTAILLLLGRFLVRLSLKHIKEGLSSQKRFISSASHELRTPLSIIKANSELALIDKTSATKEELITTMESSLEEVDRMTDILSMLLHAEENFNEVETRGIYGIEVNLSDIVYKVLSRSVGFAHQKKITVSQEVERSVYVKGSKAKLEGAVYGIFHNAVTYTPELGSVGIYLETDIRQNIAKLIIKDSGIGIPKDDLPHIFNPFYRTKFAEDKGHHGIGGKHFGLGLSVARQVVRDHNGSIDIKSSQKTGTIVTIALPLSLPASKLDKNEESSLKSHVA